MIIIQWIVSATSLLPASPKHTGARMTVKVADSFIIYPSAVGSHKPNILHLKRDVIAKLEKSCRKSRSTRLALHGGSKVRLDEVEDSKRGV